MQSVLVSNTPVDNLTIGMTNDDRSDGDKMFKDLRKGLEGQVVRGWKGLIKPSGESLISLLCHATVPDGRSHANRC